MIFEQGKTVAGIIGTFFRAVGNMFSGIPWTNMYDVTRMFFLFIDLLLFVSIVVLYFEARKMRPKLYLNPRTALGVEKEAIRVRDEALKAQWEKLMNKSESAPPQSLTLAIIEADTFVDNILKINLKLPGEHMADRLESLSGGDLKTLDHLWRAHRARNDLVHTPGYYLAAADARRVLHDYEAFLKELEVV
jgi:hypothetical protein